MQQRHTLRAEVGRFIRAARDVDEAVLDDAVMRLSRARPWLAPFAFTVGAFAMLFDGVKLLFTNWRLTLIQVLPAMCIWAAMLDLKLHLQPVTKLHLVHGRSFHDLMGPEVVIPAVLGVAAVTAAGFYLNAVFAFAIIQPGRPQIRPAFTQARSHLPIVLGWGAVVGLLLGLAVVVVPRWGAFWFGVSLGIVIGIMMVCYVAVPSRMIGVKPARSRRDKLVASAVGGAVGAVVCTPPYVLGRIGLVMLGWGRVFFVLGVLVFAVALPLQAGATGAVKTVKMSAKLVGGRKIRGRKAANGQALAGDVPASGGSSGSSP